MTVPVTPQVSGGPDQRIQELLSHTEDDLPILRQSCQGIIDCTEDDTSSAYDVSEVITHDQALLAKIIKLANSAIYPSNTPVTSSLQAVKTIGFDVIRAMAIGAEFIELASDRGGNTALIKGVLARALVSATAAQALEEAGGFPKNPNLFTNTMLYTLGDLMLAHYHPDIYRILESAQRLEPDRMHNVETELLGQPLRSLASKMAKNWGLPATISQLIETSPILNTNNWEQPKDRLIGLVCSANQLGYSLLSKPTSHTQDQLEEILKRVPQALNVPLKDLKTLTINAMKKACQLSDVVNIPQDYFVPHADWNTLNSPNNVKGFIAEIWEATAKPNGVQLLQWAAEALHRGGAFDRVVLLLLAPANGFLEPRTGYGEQVKPLLPLFRCTLKSQHTFANACRGFQTVSIENILEEMKAGRISSEFVQQWGEGPCLLGPVLANTKHVGLIVADKGPTQHPITQMDFANFSMALAQVNVNLSRLSK
jgi:HD-like signal output (HDOD) protein